ncbi:hypothetical protein [Streptococcus merionis]|uniref:hypothetical protein n=1 Tax=Streptococcus merionis TaxID=400065 RepID=UPI0026F3051F|nr:hypothetical protein [Streptococcus merionis]
MLVISMIVTVLLLSGLSLSFRKSQLEKAPTVFEQPFITQVKADFHQKMLAANVIVSEEAFWTTKVNQTTPQKELEGKAQQLFRRYQLVETAVSDHGGAVERLNLETANWQEVSDNYRKNRQTLINLRLQEVTQQQVEAYYQKHQERYQKQGRLTGKLSFWRDGIRVSEEELIIDADNVRLVTESYPGLEEHLSQLKSNQEVHWSQGDGIYYFICETSEVGEIEPLEHIMEAVATQCVEEELETWLAKES